MTLRVRALLLSGLFAAAAATSGAQTPLVVTARIDTPIHPTSASYLRRTLRGAAQDGAALIVLEISTPGGLYSSTREMCSAILASPVPVATYVSPAGTHAASAGFFLLMAGDVAAMAPGTNTGSAHPVGGEGQDLPKVASEKAAQDAKAFLRTMATQRGRNAEKAEAAVEKSVSYTEAEAKAAGLTELVARDVPDLLTQLEGRTLRRVDGKEVRLALSGHRIEARQMSRLEKLVGVVSHPNIAYVLFLLGLMGLYFELSNPGAILPGIVGGIALVLALYAFSVLPVNLAGIVLILFGIALFIAEIKVVSHGLLAAGGAIAMIAGTLLLFAGKGETPEYRVDLGVIIPTLVLALATIGFLTWQAVRAQIAPVTTGLEGMIGEAGRVADGFGGNPRGRVLVFGEYWEAEGPPDLARGDDVRVVALDDLRVRVERRKE
ncbi:MAG TPA: nodulation protein NfeD [Thermoanaerobaculia bacterium]|jgi:membrane-bound serine protease (ClpP class)